MSGKTEVAQWPIIAVAPVVLRAAEIALAGGHKLGLLSCGNVPDCADVARDVQMAGGEAIVLMPCPCGALGSAEACVCSDRRCNGWTRRPQVRADVLSCDLIVEVAPVMPIAVYALNYPLQSRPESWADVLGRREEQRARVEDAAQKNSTVDAATMRFIERWTDKCRPPMSVQKSMQQVARTIAAIGGEFAGERGREGHGLAIVSTAAVAEAIQYATSNIAAQVWRGR